MKIGMYRKFIGAAVAIIIGKLAEQQGVVIPGTSEQITGWIFDGLVLLGVWGPPNDQE